jgi:hypothetical protein
MMWWGDWVENYGKIVCVHAMKALSECGSTVSLILNRHDRWEWGFYIKPRPLYPPKDFVYQMNSRLDGPPESTWIFSKRNKLIVLDQTSRQLSIIFHYHNLRKKLVKFYIRITTFYGAETCTIRLIDQKYLGSFEMLCWRNMEISWIDHVRNEEVLQRVKEERIIPQTLKGRKVNWIGHILHRNYCLL